MSGSTQHHGKHGPVTGASGDKCGVPESCASAPNPPRASASMRRRARLLQDIETRIVPRLILAHRSPPPAEPALSANRPTQRDVADFAQVVRTSDVGAALGYVYALQQRGTSLEALYLDLLAPAARRLGELWDADLCDFTEVTVGLWRLHQVARELSATFRHAAGQRDQGRRVLLAPAPGDQHSFGLCIVADFFRRAGWDVWAEQTASASDLIGIVRAEWFAVVGLSAGCASRLEKLPSLIHSIRRASRNRSLGVMVGGPVFADHPDLAALVGADATAFDARHACLQAESLVTMLTQRSQQLLHDSTTRGPGWGATGRSNLS